MSFLSFSLPLVSFLCGVAISSLYGVTLPVSSWICLVGGAVTYVSWMYYKSPFAYVVAMVGIGIVALSLGMIRFELASFQFGQSRLTSVIGTEVLLEGVVHKEPDVRLDSVLLYVDTGQDVVLVRDRVGSSVSYGDRVQVIGELTVPEAFTTELGRTFNYPAYLLARGVEYQISFAAVTVIEQNQGNYFLSTLLLSKQVFINGIETALREPYAGLGEGLLLGVKRALGEDIEEAFRTSGIIHIVVLSGYNVMLVVTFFLFMLSQFLSKRPRIVMALIGIVGFAFLVGLSATVVRASIMASMLLIADFLGRGYDVRRALLFAGFCMVCINPYLLLYDIGFQLSFMATVGLVLVAPIFESFLTEGLSKLTVKDFLISTLATQIAVLPLLIYHIGEVSVVAVLVNVLVLPIVPVAMFATFLVGVCGVVLPAMAPLLGSFATLPLWYIVEMAKFFAALPYASFIVPPISATTVVLLYGVIASIVFFFKQVPNTKEELTDWIIEEETEKAGMK